MKMIGYRLSASTTCRHSTLLTGYLSALLASADPLHAQVEQIGNMIGVPPEVHELREAQARLAIESDIVIRAKDQGKRSATMLGRVVPLELRDELIATEYDLIDLLDEIYPYYGFTGTETLEFEQRRQGFSDIQYVFREYIGGIETSVLLTINVNPRTKQITWFNGWLELDRDLGPIPRLSREEAIDVAICVVRESDRFSIEGYWLDGPHETEVVYEQWGEDMALAPTWRVRLAPPQGRSGWQEAFSIGPNGEFRRELVITDTPEFVMPQQCLKN